MFSRVASAGAISRGPGEERRFQVPGWMHHLGGFISRHYPLWILLGDFESRYLADSLAKIAIDRPIYIAGLARSGTTKLLEVIASHPGIATHRYRDFPPIFTPYAWNWLLDRMMLKPSVPAERAHGDRIIVTLESPEAMEEALWMSFFPDLHDQARSNVLDASTNNPQFEKFYRDHIKKLALARGARRYVSKANYNLTRLEYLQKLFPDTRFVIPIRAPVNHIASLIKQHRIFSEAHRTMPRYLEHFRRVGHFEFGADRRPINTGDSPRVQKIEELWRSGQEVRGWARYWAMIYDFVADRLETRPRLREASLVVRFEDLCDAPELTLRKLCAHCELEYADQIAAQYASELRAPTYYDPKFSMSELQIIDEETSRTAARLGYAKGY